MKNNDKFDINNFQFPDASFAPIYIWVWNDICTQEIIDAQLAEMQNLGIRAFYILPEPKDFRPDSMPTNLTPDYLTEEYFELCAYAIEKGKTLGMNCWIYDEAGWPSGSAGGKVIEDHPEYSQQVLEFYEHSFSAGEVYKKTSSDVLIAFLNDKEIIVDGYIFSEDAVVTEYIAEKANDPKIPEGEKAFFLSMQYKRINVRSVEILVKKYSKLVTPLKKITPHKLRSTYGTRLYNSTGDIYIVADVLGHRDVNTTKKHYAAITEENRKRVANAVKLRNEKDIDEKND